MACDHSAVPNISVFTADPLAAYVRKGEVKARYYNPGDLFDRVQIVSPATEDVPRALFEPTVGRAELELYSSGWLDRMSWRRFPTLRRFMQRELERMLPRIAASKPDVIRTYTPQIPGWFAVEAGRQLGVPVVVSVHANLDHDVREDSLRRREYRLFASNMIQRWLVERETMRRADLVICAYRWPAEYAKRIGARRIEIVYNKVDIDRFHPQGDGLERPFTILSVGRLLKERSPDTLVRAMVGLDARLRLVGDGELYEPLQRLVRELGLGDRVSFQRRVPNDRIHEEYAAADVYAHATRYGGIHIPIIEAMASGLPLVVPRPRWESEPEVVSDIALVVEPRPEAFAAAFRRLQGDRALRTSLGVRGRVRATEMSGDKMERREADLYRELLRR